MGSRRGPPFAVIETARLFAALPLTQSEALPAGAMPGSRVVSRSAPSSRSPFKRRLAGSRLRRSPSPRRSLAHGSLRSPFAVRRPPCGRPPASRLAPLGASPCEGSDSNRVETVRAPRSAAVPGCDSPASNPSSHPRSRDTCDASVPRRVARVSSLPLVTPPARSSGGAPCGRAARLADVLGDARQGIRPGGRQSPSLHSGAASSRVRIPRTHEVPREFGRIAIAPRRSRPRNTQCEGRDSNPRTSTGADLESAAVSRLGYPRTQSGLSAIRVSTFGLSCPTSIIRPQI